MAESKKPPQSLFSRSAELLGMAAKIGSREIGRRVMDKIDENPKLAQLKTQMDQAKVLVDSLGRLKGAAMKVGQTLSLEARDLFPPEVVEVLSQLQNKAPPLPFEEMDKILRSEWSPEIYSSVSNISREPLAAASIGQVHTAEYQGKKVVLKIQYPGISGSIESDLALLQKMIRSFMLLGGRGEIDTANLFIELRNVLLQEVNYLKEAEQTEYFFEALKGHSHFRVPKPCRDLTTSQVLAMSFEEGLTVHQWLATRPPQEERDFFGKLFLDLYHWEFWDLRRVQTDPNFANFLIRPDKKEIVLLDFGATREYPREFTQEYKKLLLTIREQNSEKILERTLAMNLLSERESPECWEAWRNMLYKSLEPFQENLQPFDFSSVDYSTEIRNRTLAFTKLVKFSAPPHQLIFLHRKLGGVFAVLRSLEARVDLRPFWQNMLDKN